MRKNIMTVLAIGAIGMNGAAKNKAKNVLFLLVGDMQKTSVNAYGNSQFISPNIDFIINNGVSFGYLYANGSLSSVPSMPSRAIIMTGCGVYEVSGDDLSISDKHIILPEHLQSNRYTTFATREWHSDKKRFNRSFEKADNIFFGEMHTYEKNGHVLPSINHYNLSTEYKRPFIANKFSSEMFADTAVSFMVLQKKGGKPFFAFTAFASLHNNSNQRSSYGRQYKVEDIKLPVIFFSKHSFDNGELTMRDEVLLPIFRAEEAIKQDLANYYGIVV